MRTGAGCLTMFAVGIAIGIMIAMVVIALRTT